MQSGWVGAHIQKRRLSTLCSLTAQSLANSESIVKDKATGRCPHGVSIRTLYVCFITWRVTIFITAWALRVARQTIGAMRDALSSETSNRYSTRAFFVQIKKPNHNKTCWGCCKCKVSFRNGRAISTVEQQAAHWQSDKGRTWKTGTNRQLVCTKVVLRPIQCLQTVQAIYNRHWVTGKGLANIAVWLLWTLQEHIIGTNRHRNVAAQASVLFNPLQR